MRLEKALAIPGARSVALIAPGERAVTWCAGAIVPGGPEADAAAGLAEAALRLVRLAGDEFGDLLITGADGFHVLRPVLGSGGADLVAYLELSRSATNVALARRDFQSMTAGVHRAPAVPVVATRRRADPVIDSDFLALMGREFHTEDAILDRILGSLKSL